MQELDAILRAKREREKSERHFAASIQGIDLSKHEKDPAQQKIEEVKRRAEIKLRGENEVIKNEFAALGFDFQAE